MSFAPKQTKPTHDFDEPKFSARTRFQQTSTSSTLNHEDKQKSIKKSSSIKYIKEISPKRSKSNSKFISNKILKLLDKYQQNLNNSDRQIQPNTQNIPNSQSCQTNRSKLGQALKSIDFDNQRNCQTTRFSHSKDKTEYKVTLKENMLEKFQSNQAKIILMRQNLQKIFTTYKERQRQLAEMKTNMKNHDKIQTQNQFLTKQIARIQQMIKQALLERQKLKYGPFSQLTKRNKK